jgi:hypothetical protein
MAAYDYDLITLGAGSGGTRASRFAAQVRAASIAQGSSPQVAGWAPASLLVLLARLPCPPAPGRQARLPARPHPPTHRSTTAPRWRSWSSPSASWPPRRSAAPAARGRPRSRQPPLAAAPAQPDMLLLARCACRPSDRHPGAPQVRHPRMRAQEAARLRVGRLVLGCSACAACGAPVARAARGRGAGQAPMARRPLSLPPTPHAPTPRRCSAHFAEEFEDAHGFGWSSSRPPFTWHTLVQNKVRGGCRDGARRRGCWRLRLSTSPLAPPLMRAEQGDRAPDGRVRQDHPRGGRGADRCAALALALLALAQGRLELGASAGCRHRLVLPQPGRSLCCRRPSPGPALAAALPPGAPALDGACPGRCPHWSPAATPARLRVCSCVVRKAALRACVVCAEGRGQLVDAHTVEVTLPAGGVRRISAKHILVATGGVATKLLIEGAVRAAAPALCRGPCAPAALPLPKQGAWPSACLCSGRAGRARRVQGSARWWGCRVRAGGGGVAPAVPLANWPASSPACQRCRRCPAPTAPPTAPPPSCPLAPHPPPRPRPTSRRSTASRRTRR